MFNNLVIMLTFSPAVSTFILMRWVARNYLKRQYEACLDPKAKIRKEMENFQHLDRSSNEDEEEEDNQITIETNGKDDERQRN